MAHENNDSPCVLIAGVTGGVGAALATRFIDAGWRVGGFSRSEEKLRSFVERNPGVVTYVADATVSSQVNEVVDKWMEKAGRIDAYLHCVGSIILKPAHSISDEEFDETLSINLRSAFYGLRAVVRPMMKAGCGSVGLVSTVAAQVGVPNHEAIAAAKAGIDGLVRSAASTYAGKGIRVNAVAPGMMDTEMAKSLLGSEQGRKLSAAMHPLGRVGQAADIASLLFWLSQPENDWVTGQVWSVDGGMAAVRQRTKV